MKTSRVAVRPPALACLILVWAVPAFCSSRRSVNAAEAEAHYQAGVDAYADGRMPEALAAFQEAVRLNPGDRAARSAVERVRVETRRQLVPRGAPVARRGPPSEEGSGRIAAAWIENLVLFERSLGDARDQQGELAARQGRIAQLLIERRVSRENRRAFGKDEELHALARRLPTVLS